MKRVYRKLSQLNVLSKQIFENMKAVFKICWYLSRNFFLHIKLNIIQALISLVQKELVAAWTLVASYFDAYIIHANSTLY